MNGHQITLLGTGLIGGFYAMALHGQRSRDRIEVVYSRTKDRGSAFGASWDIPEHTTDLAEAINHPKTDVAVAGVPNHMHEQAVPAAARAAKAGLSTKPLG